MPRLLLIDDDRELCSMLTELLQAERFSVDAVHEGQQGVSRAVSGDYALVVLDVMLPDISGLQVLREIRGQSTVPVLMLTAKGSDVDRIVGLELGADDYLPKPFHSRELSARIQAILRRSSQETSSTGSAQTAECISVEDLRVDTGGRTAHVGAREICLTSVEYDLLVTLVKQAGTPVERQQISRSVLGRSLQAYDRSIDVHISSLRRKLSTRLNGSPRIQTIRGVGYLYVKPADE